MYVCACICICVHMCTCIYVYIYIYIYICVRIHLHINFNSRHRRSQQCLWNILNHSFMESSLFTWAPLEFDSCTVELGHNVKVLGKDQPGNPYFKDGSETTHSSPTVVAPSPSDLCTPGLQRTAWLSRRAEQVVAELRTSRGGDTLALSEGGAIRKEKNIHPTGRIDWHSRRMPN